MCRSAVHNYQSTTAGAAAMNNTSKEKNVMREGL
jgi:hypothetical protein